MFWSRFWLMRREGSSPTGLVASASWRLALRRWGLMPLGLRRLLRCPLGCLAMTKL